MDIMYVCIQYCISCALTGERERLAFQGVLIFPPKAIKSQSQFQYKSSDWFHLEISSFFVILGYTINTYNIDVEKPLPILFPNNTCAVD